MAVTEREVARLTGNQTKELLEHLDFLNNVIPGPPLTAADFVVTNEYGDIEFADEERAEEIRKALLDRPVPGHERFLAERVAELLNIYFPSEEIKAERDRRRREHTRSLDNIRRRQEGLFALDADGREMVPEEPKRAEAPRKAAEAKPRRVQSFPSGIDGESRLARLKAEGHPQLAGDDQRSDVLFHAPVFREDVSPEVTADRHARGILTPHEYPAAMLLTPNKDDPGAVLTPRDAPVEDRALRAAAHLHRSLQAEARAEGGAPPDTTPGSPAPEPVKKARAHAEKEAKAADEAREPIRTMQQTPPDDPRAAGEQPTIGELAEIGTKFEPNKNEPPPKPKGRGKAHPKAKVPAVKGKTFLAGQDEAPLTKPQAPGPKGKKGKKGKAPAKADVVEPQKAAPEPTKAQKAQAKELDREVAKRSKGKAVTSTGKAALAPQAPAIKRPTAKKIAEAKASAKKPAAKPVAKKPVAKKPAAKK